MSDCVLLPSPGEVHYHHDHNGKLMDLSDSPSTSSKTNGTSATSTTTTTTTTTSHNTTDTTSSTPDASCDYRSFSMTHPTPDVDTTTATAMTTTNSLTATNSTNSSELMNPIAIPVSEPDDPYASSSSTAMEVPLRRSKRGKGRPSQTAANTANNGAGGGGNNNCSSTTNHSNGASIDERVSSCIVGGVEYHTGEFVYYEEPDFEYYTIGLIEDIKFSRRDKFAVCVKCFYRTCDIPESAKQSVLERELFHSPGNQKAKNELLSRELFVSEVQESLASRQLRGLCKVSHLTDLRSALHTFAADQEDNFFYVFAYNPETRRLMHTRAEIRVGHAFQVSIPQYRHAAPSLYQSCPRHRSRCLKRCRCRHTRHTRRRAKRLKLASPNRGAKLESKQVRSDPVNTNPPKITSNHLSEEVLTVNLPTEDAANAPNPIPSSTETDALKSPPILDDFGSTAATQRSNGLSTDDNQLSTCPKLSDPFPRGSRHHHRQHTNQTNRDRRRRRRRLETLIWRPQGLRQTLAGLSDLKADSPEADLATDEPLKTYLDAVRSMVAFFGFGGGAEDDLASAENGLVLANLAVTTQHAYDTLHRCNYSLRDALQIISSDPIPSKDTPRHWTVDQVRLFAHALRIHGKDFHAIQREFFGGQGGSNSNHMGAISTNQSGIGPLPGRTRSRGRRKAIEKKVMETRDSADTKSAEDVKRDELATGNPNGVEEDSTNEVGANAVSQTGQEPVKTVKQLIAFYYFWKRKGMATAASVAPGQGGLGAVACNFSAAVAAANVEGQSTGLTAGSNTVASSLGETGVLNGSSAHSTQQQSVLAGKKRKQTSRGNALTRHAMLGLIEGRKTAESELKRRLSLKGMVMINGGGGRRGGGRHVTPPCVVLTQSSLINARASTPTSEFSESAGVSLPESEVEDGGDTTDCKPCEESGEKENANSQHDPSSNAASLKIGNAGDGTIGQTDSQSSTATTNTSHLRLRRRLCRNCGQDLPGPNDAPSSGSGQLRFLCPSCRLHLQKYGELKVTTVTEESGTGSPNLAAQSPQSLPATPTDQHRGRRRRHPWASQARSLHTPTERRSPHIAWSPSAGSIQSEEEEVEEHQLSSPAPSHSPTRTVSSHSSSLTSQTRSSSASSIASSSAAGSLSSGAESDCSSFEASSLSASSSATAAVAGAAYYCSSTSRKVKQSSPTSTPSIHQRRTSSDSDHQGNHRLASTLASSAIKPESMGARLWKSGDKGGTVKRSRTLDRSDPMMVTAAATGETVPSLARDESDPPDTKKPAVELLASPSLSSTISKAVDPRAVASRSQLSTNGSDRARTARVAKPGSGSGSSTSSKGVSGSHIHPPVAAEEEDVEQSPGGESESDTELTCILRAPLVNPKACQKEIRNTIWSRITRVWDRTVCLPLPAKPDGLLTNTGSCARTDLTYAGRGERSPTRLAEARRQLYKQHADSAIGPGMTEAGLRTHSSSSSAAVAQGKNRSSDGAHAASEANSTTAASSAAAAAALNLSAHSVPSRTPHRATPTPPVSGHRTNNNQHHHPQNNTNSSVNELNQSFSAALAATTQLAHQSAGAPSPRTAASLHAARFASPAAAAYDPSATQQQIQAAYEQAMLLAAAARQHCQQINSNQSLNRDSNTHGVPTSLSHPSPSQMHHRSSAGTQQMRSPMASTTPASSNHGRSPSSSLPMAAQISAARLAAAAGTFYPPAVASQAMNVNPMANLSRSAVSNASMVAQIQHATQLHAMGNSGVGGFGTSHAASPSYQAGPNSAAPTSNAALSMEQLWKYPELIQRQLALMGLLPPTSMSEQAMFGAMDPRELEALRRLMADKLVQQHQQHAQQQHQQQQQLNQPVRSNLNQIPTNEHQQHQQQQELLAAAAAAELLMRGSRVNDNSMQQSNAPLLPVQPAVCNAGAMTSAVNSIFTRPTASIQSPHFRHPPTSVASMAAALPQATGRASNHATDLSSNSTPTSMLNPQSAHSPFPPFSPPVAHLGSSASSTSSMAASSVAAAHMPIAAHMARLAAPQPSSWLPVSTAQMRMPPTAQYSHNNMPTSHYHQASNAIAAASGFSGSSTPTGRSSSLQQQNQQQQQNQHHQQHQQQQQQMQEQMIKFAMLAANMQSDPNKAINLAAAAALAELAARDRTTMSSGQAPHPTQSIMSIPGLPSSACPSPHLPTPQPKPPSSMPATFPTLFDMRNLTSSHAGMGNPLDHHQQQQQQHQQLLLGNDRRRGSHNNPSVHTSSSGQPGHRATASQMFPTNLPTCLASGFPMGTNPRLSTMNNNTLQSNSSSSVASRHQALSPNVPNHSTFHASNTMPSAAAAAQWAAQLSQLAQSATGSSLQDPALLNALTLAAAAASASMSATDEDRRRVHQAQSGRSPTPSGHRQSHQAQLHHHAQQQHNQQQQQHHHQQQHPQQQNLTHQQQHAAAAAAAAFAALPHHHMNLAPRLPPPH